MKMTFLLHSLVCLLVSTTILISSTNGQWQAFPRLPNTENMWMPNMPATRTHSAHVDHKQSRALPLVTSRHHKESSISSSKNAAPQPPASGGKRQRSQSDISNRQSPHRVPEPQTRTSNKVPRSNRPSLASSRVGNVRPHNRMGPPYALPPQPRNYGVVGPVQKNHKHRNTPRPTVNNRHYKKIGPIQTKSPHGALWHDFPSQGSRPIKMLPSNRIENRISPPQFKQQGKVQVPLNPDRGMKWSNLPRQPLMQGSDSGKKVTPKPTISPLTDTATSAPAPTPSVETHREPRPVSQHPGELHDSWPNSNSHHHLSAIGVTPTAKPPSSTPASSSFSNLRLSNVKENIPFIASSTTKRSVFPSSSSDYASSLSLTQKEKILHMTNTLTKLSPKKPIHVFMKLEGIALTEQGADVGEVIKKYAGSSKVPFFNGTLPMKQIPTVFLAPEDMTPPEGYGKIPIPTLKKPGSDTSTANKWRGPGNQDFDYTISAIAPKPSSYIPEQHHYPTATTARPAHYLPQQSNLASPTTLKPASYIPHQNHFPSSTEKPTWNDWSKTAAPTRLGTPSSALVPPTERLRVNMPSPSLLPPAVPPSYDFSRYELAKSSHVQNHPYIPAATVSSRSSEAFPHVDTPSRVPFIASATAAPPPGYTKVLLPPGASGANLTPEQAQKLVQGPNTKTLNTLTNEQKLQIINMLKKGQTHVYGPDGSKKSVIPFQPQQNQNSPVAVDLSRQQQPQIQEVKPPPTKEIKYKTGYKVIQAPASIDSNDPDPYSFLKGVLPEGAIVESISPLKGGPDGVALDSLTAGSISVPSQSLDNKINSHLMKGSPVQQLQIPQTQSQQMHQVLQQQNQRPSNLFNQPQQQQSIPQQPQQTVVHQGQPHQVNHFQQGQVPQNNLGQPISQNQFQQNRQQQIQQNQPNQFQHQQNQPNQFQHLQNQPNQFQQQQIIPQNQFIQNQQQASQFRPPNNSQQYVNPPPKVVVNPGIQISVPKNGDSILDKTELTQIIGSIVKSDTFSKQPLPRPQVQQQHQPLRQPLMQQGQQQQAFRTPNGPPNSQNWQQQRPGFQQNQPNPQQVQQFPQQAPHSQTQSTQQNQAVFNQGLQSPPQQAQLQQPHVFIQPAQQVLLPGYPQQQNLQQGQVNPVPQLNQQQNLQQGQANQIPQLNQQQFQQRQTLITQPSQFQQNQQPVQNQQSNQFPYQNPFPPLSPNTRLPPPGPILGAPQTIIFSQNNPKQPAFSQSPVSQTPSQEPNQGNPVQQTVNNFAQQQTQQQAHGPSSSVNQQQETSNRLPVLIPAPPPSTTRPPPPPPTRPPPPPPSRPPPKDQRPPPPPTGKSRNPLKSALSFLGIQSTAKPDLIIGKPGHQKKPHPSHRPPQEHKKDKQPAPNKIDNANDSDSKESSQHEIVVLPPTHKATQHHLQGSSNKLEAPTILIAGDGSNIPEIKRIINSFKKVQSGEKDSESDEDDSNSIEIIKSQQHQVPTPINPRPPPQFFGSSTPLPPFHQPSPTPPGPTHAPPNFYHQHFGPPTATPNPFISHVGSTGRPITSPILAHTPSPSPMTFVSSSTSPLLMNPTARPMLISPTATPGTFVVTNQSPTPIFLQSHTTPRITFPSTVPTPTQPATQQYIVQTPSGPPQIITMNANVSPAALHLAAVQSVIRQNLGLNLGPTGAPILMGAPGGNSATIINGQGGSITGVSPTGATIVLTSNTLPTRTITEEFPVKSGEDTSLNKSSSSELKSKEELLKLLSPSTTTSTTESTSERKSFSGERSDDDRQSSSDNSGQVIEKVRTEERIVWDGPTPSKVRTEERTIIRPHKYSGERESSESIRSEDRFVKNSENSTDKFFQLDNHHKAIDPQEPQSESDYSSSTSSPTSFANLLASKMKFDSLKEKLYGPQKHFLGSSTDDRQTQHQYFFQPLTPSIPREEQQRYPEHELVYLPDGRLTFAPSPANSHLPLHSSSSTSEKLSKESLDHEFPSSTVEPVTSTTPYDVNGRFKIRPGDLSKFENMTPLFSITPSALDAGVQEHMRQQEEHMRQQEERQNLELAYPSSSPPPTEDSFGSVTSTKYYEEGTRAPFSTSASSNSAPTSEEKLMFFPSSTSATFGLSEADASDHHEDERLIFFPSSTLSPPPFNEQEDALLQWEPIGQRPNSSKGSSAPEVKQPTSTDSAEIQTTTTPEPNTTAEIPSTTATSTTTTTAPPITQPPNTSTESPTTESSSSTTSETPSSDDKPITWRPTKPPVRPADEPKPATFISSAERVFASNVGANSLHAMMAGLPHEQDRWQDSSRVPNKDIGASVLYAVASGGASPGVQMHHHGVGPPGLVAFPPQYHHTMIVTPGVPGLMPSTPEVYSVTPSYYKPSSREKSYYDHWYGTAGINYNGHNIERDKYEVIEEPSTTTLKPERLRFRSKYRIPSGTVFADNGNGKKLIPIYVQKNSLRRNRYRTREPPTTTTTTQLPPADDEESQSLEYDDDIGLVKEQHHYYDELAGPNEQFQRTPYKTVRPEDIDDDHPAFSSQRKKQRVPEKKTRVSEENYRIKETQIPEDNYRAPERRPLLKRRRPTAVTTTTTTSTTTQRPYYDDTSEEIEEEYSKPVTPAPQPPPTRRRKVTKFASSETDELYDDYDLNLKPMFPAESKHKKRVRTTTVEPTTTTTTTSTTTTSTTTELPTTTPVPVKKRRKGLRRRTTTSTTTQVPEYDSSSEEISEETLPEQNITASFEPQKQNDKDQVAQSTQLHVEAQGDMNNIPANYVQSSGTSQETDYYQQNVEPSKDQQLPQMVDLSSLEVQQQQPQVLSTNGAQVPAVHLMNNAGFQNNGAEITQNVVAGQHQSATPDQQVQSPATIMIHGFQPILTQILPHRPQAFGNLPGLQQQNTEQSPQSQFHNRILQSGQFNANTFQQPHFPNNFNLMQQQQMQQVGDQQQFLNPQSYYPGPSMPSPNIYEAQPVMQQNLPQYSESEVYQQQPYPSNYFQNTNAMTNENQVPQDLFPANQNNVYPDMIPAVNGTQEQPMITTSYSVSTSTNVEISKESKNLTAVEEQSEKSPTQTILQAEESKEPTQLNKNDNRQQQTERNNKKNQDEGQAKPEHVNHDLFMMSGEAGISEEEGEHKAEFISSEVKDPFKKTASGINTYSSNGAGGSHIGLLSKKLAGMALLSTESTRLKEDLQTDAQTAVNNAGFVDKFANSPATISKTAATPVLRPAITDPTTEKPTTISTTAKRLTTVATKGKVSAAQGNEDDYDLDDLKQLLKKLSSRLSYSEELYDYYNEPSSIELLRTKAKISTTTAKPKSKPSKTKSSSKDKKKSKSKQKKGSSKSNTTTKKPKPKVTTKEPKKMPTAKPSTKPTTTKPPPKKVFTPRTTTTKKPLPTTKKPVPVSTTSKSVTEKIRTLKPKFTVASKITTTNVPLRRKTMKPIAYILPRAQSLVKETTTTNLPPTTIAPSSASIETTILPVPPEDFKKQPNKIGISQKPLWVRRRLLKSGNGTSVVSNESISPSSETRFDPAARPAEINSSGNRRAKIRVIKRRRPGVPNSSNSGTYEQISLENSSSDAGLPTTPISNLPLETLFIKQQTVSNSNLLKRTGTVVEDNIAASVNNSTTPGPRKKLKLVRMGERAQWKLTDQSYNNDNPQQQYYDSRQQNSYGDSYNYNPYNTYSSSEPDQQQQSQLYQSNPIMEALPLTGTGPPSQSQSQQQPSAEEPSSASISGSPETPRRQVRMESTVAVETTVCVRGKCEIVTKN